MIFRGSRRLDRRKAVPPVISAPCAREECPRETGSPCAYADRRGRTCGQSWCPMHSRLINGRIYCQRHAGVAAALTHVSGEIDRPDLENRAASLCAWMADDLDGAIRTILVQAQGIHSELTLTTTPLNLALIGTPRVRAWMRSWKLVDSTGPRLKVVLWVHENNDSEVIVTVDSTEVERVQPGWITRRGTPRKSKMAEDLRGETRHQLLNAVATATAERRREAWRWTGGAGPYLTNAAHPIALEQAPREANGVSLWQRWAASGARRYLHSEERSRAVLDHLPDGIVTLDDAGIIESFNPTAERLLGYEENDVTGLPFETLVAEDHRAEFVRQLPRRLWGEDSASQPPALETAGRRKNGSTFAMEVHPGDMRLGERRVFICTIRDVSDRKAQMGALMYQALHDSLTGLPNRTLFHDRLRQSLARGARQKQPFGMLLLDLDGFKEVNDIFGHDYGDALLQEIALRMQAALRQSDTLARLGGDEFAILPEGEGRIERLEATARKVIAAMERPFNLEGQATSIEASIGIAQYPEHGEDAGALMRRADAAMYAAKTSRSGYAVYEGGRDERGQRRAALLADLRVGIAEDQLFLQYQPIVDLHKGVVDGLEALVRWRHPERGILSPERFILHAEESDLAQPLAEWVLEEALRQLREWLALGLDLRMNVNLSARNAQNDRMVPAVTRMLKHAGIRPDRLVFEITERTLMAENTVEVLGQLQAMGIQMSIDDFGTGYSALNYLKQLPAAQIKINQSFITGLSNSRDDAAIVRHIINLGHNLGLTVVAEGIEDRRAQRLLIDYDCDFGQ